MPRHRRLLLAVLADIHREGVTVLLVEQDVFTAFSVAYVMETGRIVREGAVSSRATPKCAVPVWV